MYIPQSSSAPLLVFCGLIFFGNPAWADDQLNCENSTNMNQQEMNMCSYQDFKNADAELNKIWPKAKAFANSMDEDLLEGDQTAADGLLKSQKAWLIYRDQQCELEGFTSRGGSMQPLLVSGCKTKLTNARIKELNGIIDGQ